MNPLDWISAVFKPVGTIIEGWQTRQTAKLESDLKINEAVTQQKIDYIKTQQAADIAWENTAIANSGWKSGYLTIILSIPLVICFIPGLVPYVEAGFRALQETPDWYKSAVGVMIAADFGYKKFVDLMTLKKGA